MNAKMNFSNAEPIILNIKNTTRSECKAAILKPSSVEKDNYGNPRGLAVSSVQAEITYDDILKYLVGKKITLREVYIVCVINNSQAFMPYELHTEKVTDNSYNGKRVQPYVDIYQFQSGASLTDIPYMLDYENGYSEVRLTVLPGAEFNIYLFPALIEAGDKILADNRATQEFGVIRANVSAMPSDSTAPDTAPAKKNVKASVKKVAKSKKAVPKKAAPKK